MGVDDVPAWEAAGLYDSTAPGASERLALLEHLRERGATTEAMIEAEAIGNLSGLAAELALEAGRTRVSIREIAERAGAPLDLVFRLSRAAGLPQSDLDEPIMLESDVEAFRVFAAGVELFGADSAIHFGRVMGAAMATIADAATSEFARDVDPRLVESGAGELERARTVEFATSLLITQVPAAMQTLFFHHVEAAIRRAQISGSGVTAEFAVGFLDLVGSTELSATLDPQELGAVLSDFERQAAEVIAQREGRLVKTIGDEVMFVHEIPLAACVVALEIRDYVEEHPVLSSIRGGIAFGGLVRGYGDYYGTIVNIAARAVQLSDPGTVLVTDDVRTRADDVGVVRFTSVGARELRGIEGAVDLYSVERSA